MLPGLYGSAVYFHMHVGPEKKALHHHQALDLRICAQKQWCLLPSLLVSTWDWSVMMGGKEVKLWSSIYSDVNSTGYLLGM